MRASASLVALAILVAGCAREDTYPGKCQQPLRGWVTNEHGFGILGMASDIRIKKDAALTFNREPVTRAQLAQYSRELGQMNPRIFVTFAIDDGTSCEQVRAVRAIIDAGVDCNGENRGLCGEGPGPWPVFGDVPPFPIVQEYKDGHYRWLKDGVTDEQWRGANVRPPKR
jgi:hypothetical protein